MNFRQKFLNNVLQFFPTAKITLQNYLAWRPSSYINTALQLLVLDGFFLSVPTFLVTGFITKTKLKRQKKNKKTEKLFIQWLKTTHLLTFINSLTQKWMGWSTRFSSTANKSLVQMSNLSALYSNMPCTCTSHTNKQKPLARNHTVHPQPANQPTYPDPGPWRHLQASYTSVFESVSSLLLLTLIIPITLCKNKYFLLSQWVNRRFLPEMKMVPRPSRMTAQMMHLFSVIPPSSSLCGTWNCSLSSSNFVPISSRDAKRVFLLLSSGSSPFSGLSDVSS